MRIKEAKLDVLLLILFPIATALLSFALNTGFIGSMLLFFGVPSVWLSWRKPKVVKRVALFSIIFTIPFWAVIDYLAHTDKTWLNPTIFTFRIFGVVPLEDLLFGFLWPIMYKF